MATNVAAAAGTALWLGASIADIEAALGQAEVSPWRMEVSHTPNGALIINDAYNANPTSMAGALDSLDRLAKTRKVAVLGYMGELGESEADDHRRIAELAHSTGAELLTVGTDLYGQPATADVIAAIGSLDPDTAVHCLSCDGHLLRHPRRYAWVEHPGDPQGVSSPRQGTAPRPSTGSFARRSTQSRTGNATRQRRVERAVGPQEEIRIRQIAQAALTVDSN